VKRSAVASRAATLPEQPERALGLGDGCQLATPALDTVRTLVDRETGCDFGGRGRALGRTNGAGVEDADAVRATCCKVRIEMSTFASVGELLEVDRGDPGVA
jgi:hypothetical protein